MFGYHQVDDHARYVIYTALVPTGVGIPGNIYNRPPMLSSLGEIHDWVLAS